MRETVTAGTGSAVTLRLASADDEPFLRSLYADRRAPELAAVGWPPDQRQAFLELQFRAQQEGYGAAFPRADHWIVGDGTTPVGRLLVDRRPHEHRVVDLVIMTSWRGRGIGRALMREVMADAAAADVPVTLTVEAYDQRLVAWYRGMGFSVVDEGSVHLGMVWHDR